MPKPQFIKRVIAEVVNEGQINTFLTVADINGDGKPEIVVSGRNGKFVWLENAGPDARWPEHRIDDALHMECGGCAFDLTGDGTLDIINGGDYAADEIWWWQNPGPRDVCWTKRVIAKTGNGQFHDTLIGDVGDGRLSLVFTNQHGGTHLYRVPLPADPTVSPWPGLEIVSAMQREANPYRESGFQPEEGLAIGDVDGDGRNEIVCGTHWLKLTGDPARPWERHKFATGYISTKVAIADLDGDGRNEILLTEGDPCIYGKKQGGQFAWFKAPADPTQPWIEHVLDEGLQDAHSLQVGDLCGNGRPDVFVGEIGTKDGFQERPPRLFVFQNDGRAVFTRHTIDRGTGIHDAVLADMFGRGVLDIVGKPLQGPGRYEVHVWTR